MRGQWLQRLFCPLTPAFRLLSHPPPNLPLGGGIPSALAITLALLLLTSPAQAGNKQITNPSATPSVELGDLVPDFGALLPSLSEPESSSHRGITSRERAGAKPLPPESEKPAASEKPNDDTAAKPAAPQPYRVYQAPIIPEAEPSAPPEPKAQPVSVAAPPAPPPLDAKPIAAPPAALFFPLLPLNAAPGAQPQFLPLASNHGLEEDHTAVTRAVLYIHDLTRNAAEGVTMLTTLAGSDNGATLILAPQFLIDADVTRFAAQLPEQGRVVARWPVGAWQQGGDSSGRTGISSFTAVDLLLLYLSDRKSFPNLRQVVVAGHGMGADFTLRYAAVGQAPNVLAKEGMPLRFIAANPSSYLYFTAARPAANGTGFTMADASTCPNVNAYPYGLGELVPYARRSGGNAIRLRYPEREVMILVGEKFSADSFLDTSCAAQAQGRTRPERARAWQRYLVASFGDTIQSRQSLRPLPTAAYDPMALFGSYCGMEGVFGEGCGAIR